MANASVCSSAIEGAEKHASPSESRVPKFVSKGCKLVGCGSAVPSLSVSKGLFPGCSIIYLFISWCWPMHLVFSHLRFRGWGQRFGLQQAFLDLGFASLGGWFAQVSLKVQRSMFPLLNLECPSLSVKAAS
ncbi:hypothetical protein GQ457_16G026800 [Hibiscus cannabinus]